MDPDRVPGVNTRQSHKVIYTGLRCGRINSYQTNTSVAPLLLENELRRSTRRTDKN